MTQQLPPWAIIGAKVSGYRPPFYGRPAEASQTTIQEVTGTHVVTADGHRWADKAGPGSPADLRMVVYGTTLGSRRLLPVADQIIQVILAEESAALAELAARTERQPGGACSRPYFDDVMASWKHRAGGDPAHPVVTMAGVDVDVNVAGLVALLWIQGIDTRGSCQGDLLLDSEMHRWAEVPKTGHGAYVAFESLAEGERAAAIMRGQCQVWLQNCGAGGHWIASFTPKVLPRWKLDDVLHAAALVISAREAGETPSAHRIPGFDIDTAFLAHARKVLDLLWHLASPVTVAA